MMQDPKAVAASDSPDRFDGLYYSKSDEKFTVRAFLDQILGERRFALTLDVGPGPGHVSEPLARRSRNVVMVEKLPQFEERLKRRFENAEVIIGAFDEVELTQRFDVILFAHVLYYFPVERWAELTARLQRLLNPGGELILVLNSDAGDWWRIVGNFWDELGPHMGFHYFPLTAFRKELSRLGALKTHPYRYQMWIDGNAAWNDFVGRQILEVFDEDVLKAYQERFQEFSKQFKQIDGSFVLDMRGEIIRLSARD